MGGSSSKQISNEFKNFGNSLKTAFNPKTNGATAAFESLGNDLNPSKNGVSAAFQTAGNDIKNVLAPVGNALAPVGNEIKTLALAIPFAKLVQGNLGGFVSTVEGDFNEVLSLTGLSSVASILLGGGGTQTQSNTSLGSSMGPGGGGSSGGDDPGSYSNSGVSYAQPDYSDYYVIGGALVVGAIIYFN